MATLWGKHAESLVIQFWKDVDAEYAEFVVSLKSPQTVPAIDQGLHTCSYNVSDASQLTKLLQGESTIRFSLSAMHFSLSIYEHAFGVRYGYIVEVFMSTISSRDYAPWPTRIGDYLLDQESPAGCLKFAFVCEYDALREFAKQLNSMYRRSTSQNGG